MFLAKNEFKLYPLIKDPVGRLLFLNALFVIAGYALTNLTGGATTGITSTFKNVFLFGSFFLFVLHESHHKPGWNF